jgi:nuclear pore complex protein Nup54
VPALAVGFSDLKSRSEQQASEAARQLARLGELRTRLSALEQAHALRNSSRAAAAARRQVALHQRLVAHARRAHLLIPALRGASVGADEERLREKLERCEAELEAQGAGVGQGRLRARVNELWAVLGALKAKREMGKGREEWAVVDDAAIEDVAKVREAAEVCDVQS